MKEYKISRGVKRTLFFLSKKEKILLICATGLTILIGVMTSLPAYVIGKIADQIASPETFRLRELVVNIFLVGLVFLGKLAFELANKYIVEGVDTHSEKRVTDDLMMNIMKADMAHIKTLKTGTINGRIIRCIEALVEMKKLIFVEILPMLFTAISAIVIAYLKNVYVALFVCSIVPLSILFTFIQIKTQKPLKKTIVDTREEIDGKINEILGGLITIRVANTYPSEEEELDQLTEVRRHFTFRHHINIAWFKAGRLFLEGLFTIGTILLCIYYIRKGQMSEGDILVYVLLFNEVAHPLRELDVLFNTASEKTFLISNLWKLFHCPQDETFRRLTSDEIKGREKRKVDNDIVIEDLSYVFPSTGRKVLNHVNLRIKEGEHLGIMGYSGSGKSALAKILLRIYHGYDGRVLIRGKDLKYFKRSELSKTMFYLEHEPYIFYGSIRDNICYGQKGRITDEELYRVAKKAEIYDDIMSMPHKFDTPVEERGTNLSPGQRQKLGLARLMILHPHIIILDEATSTLDNISENRILRSIDRAFPNQTRISISHRYKALESCDRIIIFNKGEIIFEGVYDEVNTVEQLYKLHNIQREADVEVLTSDDDPID